ncbi:hypothetical protein MHBO_001371, partial [Bonamia ostreae]
MRRGFDSQIRLLASKTKKVEKELESLHSAPRKTTQQKKKLKTLEKRKDGLSKHKISTSSLEKLLIPKSPLLGKTVIDVEDLHFSFEDKAVFRGASFSLTKDAVF